MTDTRWFCENPDCQKQYTEYVNGCPACSARDLTFSVKSQEVEPMRLPVTGAQSFPQMKRAAKRIYGEVWWEENPDYVGPRSLIDQKGFSDVQGWLVVYVKKGTITL